MKNTQREYQSMITLYGLYDYMKTTGVDFLVADLGTEQQSQGVGKNVYLKTGHVTSRN